ncbi:hypothetical protein BJ994_001692 [Arthrobacter pigmenti]|uniref:Uncharacterized protein n=1 Tax=Arthrobacter pigmenti TaxID=271432 RepID=A0A846RU97_9MICC|nr:hypothetical protein [Arthrobacter pigmenti]NJC22616.1 hypothetical protein [Arthrobacter pigmenti]
MVSNHELVHAGSRSLVAVASALGVLAALKAGSALKDAVMVLSTMDEAAY